MFKVLLLICSTAIPRPDCQEDTALDVIQGPDVQNELMCGFHGQAYIADTAIKIEEGQWLKIKCIRTTIGKGNVG